MKKKAPPILLALLLVLPLSASKPGAEMYKSAKSCRECHLEIYGQWMSSRHAGSFTDPLFRESFNRLIKTSPGGLEQCFFCHAPLGTVSESPSKAGPVIREGVTCDFCHTVNEVTVTGSFPKYLNRPGLKRGPIKSARSTYHNAMYSPLILQSKLCEGCHEFRNRHGVGILTTVSEWKESSYCADGTYCQNCHMPRPFKDMVFLSKRVNADTYPDHRMNFSPGPGQYKDAFRFMGYLFIKRQRAYVEIALLNDKGGHMLPTGIPSRRIGLTTKLIDDKGNKLGKQELFFERLLGDGRGNILTSPEEILLHAEKVLRDSRIAPGEDRKLSMIFPLLKSPKTLYAELTLFYEFPSRLRSSVKKRIPIKSITIPYHSWNAPWEIIILIIILVAAGSIAYAVFKPAGKR
jgi:hypothetical protein